MLIPGIYGRKNLKGEIRRIFRPRTIETDSILPKILAEMVVKEGSIEDVEAILSTRRDLIKTELSSLFRAVRHISLDKDPVVHLLWARIPETDSDTPVVLVGSGSEEMYSAIPLEDLKMPLSVKDKAVQMIAGDNFYLLTNGDLLEPREP